MRHAISGMGSKTADLKKTASADGVTVI